MRISQTAVYPFHPAIKKDMKHPTRLVLDRNKHPQTYKYFQKIWLSYIKDGILNADPFYAFGLEMLPEIPNAFVKTRIH